jgi:FkbM family methyltransferase
MSDIPLRDLRARLASCRKPKWCHVLEIGACNGDDTKILLSSCRFAHIHCFECDPRAIARWRTNVRSDRATLYEVALSDFHGTATFHPSGGNPGGQWAKYGEWDMSGSLLEFDRHHENAPWMTFPPPFEVNVTTLDQWAAQHIPADECIALAWVDVQGAEAKVIEGGRNTLSCIYYWYCECDSRPNYKQQATKDDLVAALPDFTLVAEYPGYNLLFRNTNL